MAPSSDPSRGIAPPDLNQGAASALVEAVPVAPADPLSGLASPVITGQRWHAYQIGDPIEGGPGWCFFAVNVGMLDDVIIRIFPIDERTPLRAKTWEQLQEVNQVNLLEGFSIHEEGGFRYEISRVPPPTTLKEWSTCRKAGSRDVELLVRQLSTALGLLHDRGVVHLNIRPTTIFIGADEKEMQVVLGGLEHATLYDQKELIPIEVDPFYAPPEAAGLSQHSPGASLRLWDWWCLGRVIQEIVLGRHILAELLGRDLSAMTAEMRAKAESLLLEKENGAPRAGAVERMKGLDTEVGKLLRGLLTSSRDGRWGFAEVQRWLGREPVLDRYQLGRNDRLFYWKDRSFSVPEAAEFFAKEENWNDGLTHLYSLEEPGTFVHFLGEVPSYRQTRERLDEWRLLGELPAWSMLPEEVVRSVIAAATWCFLKGAKSQLSLGGRRIEMGYLRLLAGANGPPESRAILMALTSLPFIQMIEKADPDVARLLGELASTVSEAISQAEKHGWLLTADEDGHARLLRYALEPEATLKNVRGNLIQKFAVSRDPALAPLLATTQPSRSELVLLAFAEENPRQYGFITHLEWDEERLITLTGRGTRLAGAIFWLSLARALWVGSLVYGSWIWVAMLWGAVGGILWRIGPDVFHGPLAILPLIVAAGLRILGFYVQRSETRRHAPDSPVWTWRSGGAQCRDEASKAAEDFARPTLLKLTTNLTKINAEMTSLSLRDLPAPIRAPYAIRSGTAVIASWFAFLLLLGIGGGYRVYRDGEYNFLMSIRRFLLPLDPAAIDMNSPLKVVPPTPEELFFHDYRFPQKPWLFQEPLEAPPLPIDHLVPASPDQVAIALVEAQRLLQPYARKSINSLVAVSIPLEHEIGLMIYDGRKRVLANHRIFVLRNLPQEPTWFSIGDRKVLFLRREP